MYWAYVTISSVSLDLDMKTISLWSIWVCIWIERLVHQWFIFICFFFRILSSLHLFYEIKLSFPCSRLITASCLHFLMFAVNIRCKQVLQSSILVWWGLNSWICDSSRSKMDWITVLRFWDLEIVRRDSPIIPLPLLCICGAGTIRNRNRLNWWSTVIDWGYWCSILRGNIFAAPKRIRIYKFNWDL